MFIDNEKQKQKQLALDRVVNEYYLQNPEERELVNKRQVAFLTAPTVVVPAVREVLSKIIAKPAGYGGVIAGFTGGVAGAYLDEQFARRKALKAMGINADLFDTGNSFSRFFKNTSAKHKEILLNEDSR